MIRDTKLDFSEYEIDLLTSYAIRGSRRLQPGMSSDQPINVKSDLIQFYNLMKSCEPVVKHMRKEVDDQKKKQQEYDMFEDEMTKFRRELERRDKE